MESWDSLKQLNAVTLMVHGTRTLCMLHAHAQKVNMSVYLGRAWANPRQDSWNRTIIVHTLQRSKPSLKEAVHRGTSAHSAVVASPTAPIPQFSQQPSTHMALPENPGSPCSFPQSLGHFQKSSSPFGSKGQGDTAFCWLQPCSVVWHRGDTQQLFHN